MSNQVYENGDWVWDSENEKINFIPISEKKTTYVDTSKRFKFELIHFKDSLNRNEEITFLNRFARPSNSYDFDVITLQDIKNLVLFLAPSKFLTAHFVEFFHTKTVDSFLNALIIYFEYFLKIVQFILYRRKETSGENGKIQDNMTTKVKRILSEYLTQYRILVAREYGRIIIAEDVMAPYHHQANKLKMSRIDQDKTLYETFFAFCNQIVWISMHRRHYKLIVAEINRLFRSANFTNGGENLFTLLKLNASEEQIICGKNDRKTNPRNQISPAINELLHIEYRNSEILWIGNKMYNGTNPRICKLQQEFVVPDAQLSLIDISHGILGHKKFLYTTMLSINWHAVRQRKFTIDFDPYRLIRPPVIELPTWEEFIHRHERVEPYFEIKNISREEDLILLQKKRWKMKEKILKKATTHDVEDFDIVKIAERKLELDRKSFVINKEKIINEFLAKKAKLTKQKI